MAHLVVKNIPFQSINRKPDGKEFPRSLTECISRWYSQIVLKRNFEDMVIKDRINYKLEHVYFPVIYHPYAWFGLICQEDCAGLFPQLLLVKRKIITSSHSWIIKEGNNFFRHFNDPLIASWVTYVFTLSGQ